MIQNKHIIRLSFIGLFINIVANIALYRYFMIEEVVLKQIAAQNLAVAKLYKAKVWDPNRAAIENLKEYSFEKLLSNKEFINFAQKSNEFFSSTHDKISIYNHNGDKIIVSKVDTNLNEVKNKSASLYNKLLVRLDRLFLKKFISNQPLADAYRGMIHHNLISRSTVIDAENRTKEISYISSYVPIIGAKNSGKLVIDGVMEITVDITNQWDNITWLEMRIFFAFLVVFGLFFIIIMYNTNYAQKIINKQFETNRALEEAKIQAETESSAKTEFLANISHELRTPLNAIIGFSEIMLSETYGKIENKQYLDYVGDINNSGKHLLSVINDILDFSKASADKLQVERVELDLNKLAFSSLRFLKPRADEAGVELITKAPPEHIIILADPKRLKQALLNILSNSVKFTPAEGSVTLSIKKDPESRLVSISVKDTGIGMEEKDIPKALSSFGQVDNKLSRRFEGTGLGLPLTKKLVELMGGELKLESKIGKGTEVTLTFEYSESIEL